MNINLTLIGQSITFLFFVMFVMKFVWPPLVTALEERKKTIADGLAAAEKGKHEEELAKKKATTTIISLAVIGALLFLLGKVAPSDFMGHFTVFVLAVFVGWQVIWNVSHALHTPLIAVTNAISGIIIIGGLLQTTDHLSDPMTMIAFVAILVASINIVGGFFVTHRMLKMFRR